MRNIAHRAPFAAAMTMPQRLAVWNQRLLILAAVSILWSASVLALQAAGPKAQAVLAGEGMLVAESQ